MHAEGIEGVVVARSFSSGTSTAQKQSKPAAMPITRDAAGRDAARGRGDRDQPGHGAGCDAEHARLALDDPFRANIHASAAAAVAICVTAMAMPARPSAATAEPALKPNQPTQSSEAPDHA